MTAAPITLIAVCTLNGRLVHAADYDHTVVALTSRQGGGLSGRAQVLCRRLSGDAHVFFPYSLDRVTCQPCIGVLIARGLWPLPLVEAMR